MIPAPYETTQKAILVEEVATLCRLLNRPVSSKDLTKRWKELPGNRPLFIQRTGQNLIKAARAVNGDNPVLHKIGVIGNLAFYADEDSPYWRERFFLHEIAVRAKMHVTWGIPHQAAFLLGTEHDDIARNALWGFLVEWSVAKHEAVVPDGLRELVQVAEQYIASRFIPKCPTLVSRAEAAALILSEIERRNPFFEGALNINRHLARLCWPQSTLFKEQGFWPDQVRHYCAALWPSEDDDPLIEKAVWLCGIYGEPGLIP